MKIHYLTSAQKKKLLVQLEAQFGIQKLPYLLIESGKEKIRAFSGHLSKEELSDLNNTINLELIGLYLIKKEHDLRLSLDATHILNAQITKNKLEIPSSELQNWLKGQDLEIKKPRATYIIENSNLNLGCGKSNTEKILNHIPKGRRLKK